LAISFGIPKKDLIVGGVRVDDDWSPAFIDVIYRDSTREAKRHRPQDMIRLRFDRIVEVFYVLRADGDDKLEYEATEMDVKMLLVDVFDEVTMRTHLARLKNWGLLYVDRRLKESMTV
jgi:hypothetical protein